jgi:hypothetical protein
MRSARVWPAVILVLLGASPAAAQTTGSRSADDRLFALGGGGVVFVVPGEGMAFLPSAIFRVNVLPRLAVEAGGDFWLSRGLYGFYRLQAHLTPGARTGRVTPFLNVGTLGGFRSYRVLEYTNVLPTGDVVHRAAYRRGEISRPFGILAGGGARVRLSPAISLETGGHFLLADEGWALMFNATAVVPFGPRRSSRSDRAR